MKKIIFSFIICICIISIFIACASQEIIEETVLSTTIPISTQTPIVTEETEPLLFAQDIEFTYEYITNEEQMPYVLYIPSTATQSESIPLIVWLHGSGEVSVGPESFLNSGLLKVLNEWSLEGFNAYVLCPHLAQRWSFDNWRNQYAVNHLQQLLDTIIKNYNIDINNIIIVGHSLGGDGAMYMACELPNYFSKLVVLSGYWSSPNLEKIVIPTRGYVGTIQHGEDCRSVYYMTYDFATIFGKENLFMVEVSHGEVPKATFTEDKNNNNRSDIIEWMFDKLED